MNKRFAVYKRSSPVTKDLNFLSEYFFFFCEKLILRINRVKYLLNTQKTRYLPSH